MIKVVKNNRLKDKIEIWLIKVFKMKKNLEIY